MKHHAVLILILILIRVRCRQLVMDVMAKRFETKRLSQDSQQAVVLLPAFLMYICI